VAQPRNPLDRFLLYSHTVKTPQTATDGQRIAIVTKHLHEICLEFNVERILLETPTSLYVKRGRSLESLKVLLQIGAVYAAAGYLGIPVHGLTVKEWKGATSSNKQISIDLAKTIWAQGEDLEDDEAEAQLLCLSAVQEREVRAAYTLAAMQVPAERILGALNREWMYGAREIERLEKRAATRLKGKGGR
jgi:Holliday junction resolvasome RuvABC endonuclease subunit